MQVGTANQDPGPGPGRTPATADSYPAKGNLGFLPWQSLV